MRKIFFLLVLALVWGGATNVYHAVRYRTPPVTTLAETPARSLPTFVTLKDIKFDMEHLLKLEFGTEILFVPILAKDASPKSEYTVVIQTSAPKLISAVNANSIETLTHLAALARKTEVTGRISHPGNSSREVKELRKVLPQISENVVILDEGATPHPIYGSIMLIIGLGLVALTLGGAFKKVAPAPPPEAVPPKA